MSKYFVFNRDNKSLNEERLRHCAASLLNCKNMGAEDSRSPDHAPCFFVKTSGAFCFEALLL